MKKSIADLLKGFAMEQWKYSFSNPSPRGTLCKYAISGF